MKFLIVTHYKDSYYALPKDKRMELAEAAIDWANKCMKENRCKELYGFGNFDGHVSIWDITSSEEIARNCMGYPLFDYVHLEATPLVEWDIVIRMRREAIESAGKGAKAPQKVPAMSK